MDEPTNLKREFATAIFKTMAMSWEELQRIEIDADGVSESLDL